MRIGIVSDTHGELAALEAAMEIFDAHEVDAVVHCGDVGSSDCVRALADERRPAYLVAGNMDRHIDQLLATAQAAGVHFSGEVVEVPLGDGRFLVATHGQDANLLGELIRERQFPYVCHGHTHKPRDERVNEIRVINPGALHNAHPPTVAVLDTATDHLEHIIVPV